MATKNGDQITVGEIWKTTFKKKKKKRKIFNDIWLKLGDHEYINIAEIKFR